MKLIDKDDLLAKIIKRRDAALTRQHNLKSIGQESVLNEMIANELNLIISLINTLEVKEVNLDKEEERIWKDFNMGECLLSKNDLEKISKHFFELGLSVSNKARKGE